jgi:hypothetical protein
MNLAKSLDKDQDVEYRALVLTESSLALTQ